MCKRFSGRISKDDIIYKGGLAKMERIHEQGRVGILVVITHNFA